MKLSVKAGKLDFSDSLLLFLTMPETVEKKEEIYKADPFTFVFRELDLIHREVREVKDDIKRLENKIDKLYLLVISILIAIVAFLIKQFFFKA